MTYSDELVEFVKNWESCSLKCYQDIGGVWTVGWGTTGMDVDTLAKSIHPYITQEDADSRLIAELDRVAAGVNRLVVVPLEQHQFDALVSFAYNCGLDEDEDIRAEGLGDSTLLKCVNSCRFDAAAMQFPLWCHVKGQKSRGLERRRISEMAMWRYGDYSGHP